ncbi:MAG: hypothetical protein IJM49_00820 [Firmicutes bacterium]|nr:hypothetical protein [Bacillota bacterium]
MKKIIPILSLAILFAGLFVSAQAYADERVDVYTANLFWSNSFRHSEEGYWYLSANGGSARIYDSSIEEGDPVCTGTALLAYTLPGEVVRALKEHPDLKVRLERPSQVSCVDFDRFAYRFTGPGTMDMAFMLKPVICGRTLNDYIEGLGVTIPLVDYNYGRNIYEVYPLIGGCHLSHGFYSEADPGWISPPLVHPSQIKDCKGHFRSGVTINVNDESRSGALYTIGRKRTASMEESVLLHFECPVRLVFYYGGPEDHSQTMEGDPWASDTDSSEEKPFSLKLHRVR